jgi:ABC-type branched-subunit amino acid transport system substrate-binding protein
VIIRVRAVAVLAVCLLLTTACGARLTDEQWDLVRSGQAGQAGPGSIGTGPVEAGGPVAGPTTGPGGATGVEGTETAAGGGGPTATGGDGEQTGRSCTPRGAPDKGVTESTITIANVADISGIQPGLFQSAQDAVKAFTAYQNGQGGICGRNLQLVNLDTKQDTTGNRAATLTACDKAFAIVGSLSAFDQGGASSGQGCGIPEIPALTTSLQKVQASTVYPAYPNRPDYFISAEPNYIKEKYPQVIDNAGIIWLAADVPRASAAARIKGLQRSGFNVKYRQEVQPVEANYAPYVFDMQRQGIEYLTMVGNFQSIARLLDAMRQQSWYPTVRDFDSVVYDPDFLADAGPSAEGSLFFINTAMIEEIGSNPEMQLYASWLRRVAPGAAPDYFGLYAWSAGRLFAEAMTRLGPSPTRKGLIAGLARFGKWGGNGLHAEHDISKKISSPCLLYGAVQGGRFVRKDPSSGWMCNKGPVIKV